MVRILLMALMSGCSAHHLSLQPLATAAGVRVHRRSAVRPPRIGAPESLAYEGETRWTFSWGYTPREAAGGCEVRRPHVRLDLTVALPPQRRPADGSVDLWRTYRAAVVEHERAHERRAIKTSQALYELLASNLPTMDCAARHAYTTQHVLRLLKQHEDTQRAYDVQTHHGATEGAIWPPPSSE